MNRREIWQLPASAFTLFLIMGSTAVFAAESWVADPTTGCKIGWVSNVSTLSAASWSGPVVGGRAAGKGTITLAIRGKDGKELHGRGEAELVAGILEGKCSLKWSDGQTYDGDYKAGIREGKGVMVLPKAGMYDGEWKNGWSNGHGVSRYPDGRYYQGEWKNGLQNGKGIMKWPNGQVYEGEWKGGMMEGKGVLKYNDGTGWATFEGEFRNDRQNGYGVSKDANGKVKYAGEWKDGRWAGKAE